ncbi:MAG TPA: hypothetical protein VFV52_00350 [Bacilli bacterium]|nr:hypothetical protein [Bacilli bacterium]
MEKHRLTHDDMEHRLLSGDKIDTTTREEQEDYEIDRQPSDRTQSLVDLPLKNQKI